MSIKNSISTLSILLFFSLSLFAQDAPERNRVKRNMIDIPTELNLTEDQTVQLKELKEKQKLALQQIFQNEELDKDQKKIAIEKQKTQMKESMAQFLNPEQMAQLEEMQAQRSEMRLQKRKEFAEKRKERAAKMKVKKEERQLKREEIKAYHKENIEPVLLEQRKKLESQLSGEDKQKIEDIRTKRKAVKHEMKERKIERKEKMKGRKKEMKARKEEMKDRKEKMEMRKEEMKGRKEKMKAHKELRKEKVQEFKEKHREDIETIEYLLDKYKIEIEDLMDEIYDDKSQWKEDLTRIKGNEDRGQRGNHEKSKGKKHKEGKAENRSLARFLLMETNGITELIQKSSLKNSISEFSVFPNPTTEFSTIKYSLEQAGTVQLGLYEEGGKLIKSILNEYTEAGNYELNVNVQDLRPGYYIYTIKTEQGVKSQRILVSE
jgi:hypothetical protein